MPKNGNDSSIRFQGGAKWRWEAGYHPNQDGQTASLYIDDMRYAYFAQSDGYGVEPWDATGKTPNWYRGPMVLNDHFRMYDAYSPQRNNNDKRRLDVTFSAKVSGKNGFRPGISD